MFFFPFGMNLPHCTIAYTHKHKKHTNKQLTNTHKGTNNMYKDCQSIAQTISDFKASLIGLKWLSRLFVFLNHFLLFSINIYNDIFVLLK